MQDASEKTTKNLRLTIMIEGSKSDKNYSAYIPELRLGAVGDTIEDVRESIIDLAKAEIKRNTRLPIKSNAPIIETVDLAM